jgi:hypothetical protein
LPAFFWGWVQDLIEIRDFSEKAALLIAVKVGDPEMIDLLLTSGLEK